MTDREFIYTMVFVGADAKIKRTGELIRCKDCKYAKCIEQNDDWWECSHDRYDALIDNRVMHGDDFCSRAERKEE